MSYLLNPNGKFLELIHWQAATLFAAFKHLPDQATPLDKEQALHVILGMHQLLGGLVDFDTPSDLIKSLLPNDPRVKQAYLLWQNTLSEGRSNLLQHYDERIALSWLHLQHALFPFPQSLHLIARLFDLISDKDEEEKAPHHRYNDIFLTYESDYVSQSHIMHSLYDEGFAPGIVLYTHELSINLTEEQYVDKLSLAIEQGSAEAAVNLALHYGQNKDKKSSNCYRRIAATNGDPHSMVLTANALRARKSSREAFAYYRKSAETGSAEGIAWYAYCLCYGIGCQQDYAKALTALKSLQYCCLLEGEPVAHPAKLSWPIDPGTTVFSKRDLMGYLKDADHYIIEEWLDELHASGFVPLTLAQSFHADHFRENSIKTYAINLDSALCADILFEDGSTFISHFENIRYHDPSSLSDLDSLNKSNIAILDNLETILLGTDSSAQDLPSYDAPAFTSDITLPTAIGDRLVVALDKIDHFGKVLDGLSIDHNVGKNEMFSLSNSARYLFKSIVENAAAHSAM